MRLLPNVTYFGHPFVALGGELRLGVTSGGDAGFGGLELLHHDVLSDDVVEDLVVLADVQSSLMLREWRSPEVASATGIGGHWR